jgi:tetratricopeptide (TPR) repeat protein
LDNTLNMPQAIDTVVAGHIIKRTEDSYDFAGPVRFPEHAPNLMNPNNPPRRGGHTSRARPVVLIAVVCVLATLVVLLVRLRPTPNSAGPADTAGSAPAAAPTAGTHSGRSPKPRRLPNELPPSPSRPAAEIVAEKTAQFARSHENLVAALAKHLNVTVPPEVGRFFAAVAAGNWQETTNLFSAMKQLCFSEDRPAGLEKIWPAIVETYGVAEQTQKWPPQQLLDYGNAVLDSLRPGMIYMGGNDAGRFIPTLLSETSDGESHIVLSQNALADATYLDYVRFRYGDKLNVLSPEDSQNSFQAYIADAQKRLKHDQDFPNEPKQVRPGEDIRVTDGRLQVSGQVAVMAINEQLLRTLLQKNTGAAFALAESFPLKSFYADATTLGPITELRATDSATALTPERAAESVDYWRSVTQTVLADTEANSAPREAYAKMILGQGGLFEERKLPAQAEQAFQLATSLSPGNAEAVFRYVNLLLQQQRSAEALQVVQTAVNAAPNNEQLRDLMDRLGRMK